MTMLVSNKPEDERPTYDYEESHHLTLTPHPKFKPGTSAEGSEFLDDWRRTGQKVGYTAVDPEKTDPHNIYRLLIGGVTPRPIAFVSSISSNGTRNLAPFSYFNVVNHEPPLLIIACHAIGPGEEKDTAANIKSTKTFTVNMVSEPFVNGMNWTAIAAPSDVDEWHGSGLTPEKSTLIEPLRVQESAFSMECELWKDLDLTPSTPNAQPTAVLIIGLIKLIHVRNDIFVGPDDPSVVNDGARPYTIDATKFRAVSRMGGITYGRIGDGFEIPRAKWEDAKQVYADKAP